MSNRVSTESPPLVEHAGSARRAPWWLLLALVLLGLSRLIVEPLTVAGASMEPTLPAEHRVWLWKATWTPPEPGKIVAFHGPGGDLYLKRVIAVGGDRIEIIDGDVWVNAHLLVEPYLHPTHLDSVFMPAVTVPEGQLFVLGDNRFESFDSRDYGPIEVSQVIGTAIGEVRWPSS
jgi:signal peptidase I